MKTTAAASQAPAAHFTELTEKITSKTARVGVVGLGYVGLPLAVEYAKAGFRVTGIDLQEAKVDRLNAGESYIQDVPTNEVAEFVKNGRLSATSDFSVVAELDTINICVPTPLRKTKDPDMSFIVSACEEIAKFVHPGMLAILESTTYPGTTDELVLRPMLEHRDCKSEKTFSCASLLSVSTRAIRSSKPGISPRWSAVQRRHVPNSAACSMRRLSRTWCRSVPRKSPRW